MKGLICMQILTTSVQIIQTKLRELGHINEIQKLTDSSRTAQEAADALGCDIAQIAKSIVFRLKSTGEPLLIVASGINRINPR